VTADGTGTARESVLTRLQRPVGAPRGGKAGVGGLPQVSLLPTEVRLAGSAAHHRRRLVAAVVVALVLAGGGIAAASNVEQGAQGRLSQATAQSAVLRTQLAKFNDVRALQQKLARGEAAVKVGGATTIDWDQQIRDLEADKPAGYTVTTIDASGASPLVDFPQGTTLVEQRRAATVVLTLHAGTVGDEFSEWLRQLRSLPACADVSGSTSVDTTNVTTVTITVHLRPTAITKLAAESK
jgi:hypothetical protein